MRTANRLPVFGARSALLLALTAILLTGCGGTSKRTTVPSRHTSGSYPDRTSSSRPRYSPAKRLYLAHFHPDCASTDKQANASTALLEELIDRIGAGKPRAVGELVRYLNALATAFESTLHEARRFGRPPGPESNQAIAYLSSAEAVVHAIRRMSSSVRHLEPAGIRRAIAEVTRFTDATERAAARYGIPTCPNSSPARSDQPTLPAI